MSYRPPLREHLFLLCEVLRVQDAFAETSADLIEQILDEAGRFCAEVLAPLNAVGDKHGCIWRDGAVTTPPGFADAYKALTDAGWPTLGVDPAWGGQGLPAAVGLAFSEMSSSANMAFSMYPGLTHGSYSAIVAGGSEEQKALYLAKLGSGRWCGAMSLTEPQCGTDLGLLRTKAVAAGDGSWRISGQKIWISGGEHDLAENIVHLVLARIEGAPAGVRGISLFIAPKFLPDAKGDPGQRNSVSCAGLEEKMGIHGNATCVIAYEEATAWLVGEENRGLALMFVMMNEARLGVALQGLSQGEAAYQAAADFARDRLQGRALKGPANPDGPADPIIVHPDVRRLLMDARAILEGGRAFLFWTALHGDLARTALDEAARQKSADYMGLMTPVLKAFLTERGFQVCSDALQVCGGAGFTEHLPLSQYLRDCRISLIYEGTNGVQALDLVGRKLAANGGRAITTFLAELDAFVAAHEGEAEVKDFIDGVAAAKAQLQDATLWLMQHGLADPDNAAAASADYLRLFALTALAYMWALMARTAQGRAGEDAFYAAKLATGRYFLARTLPEAGAHLAKLKSGAAVVMALPAEAF